MNKNSLVSIITPSYNSVRFIKSTIKSVLNQTYENWEMIIVDDVSSDNSNEIIEKYSQKDSRIILIKLKENSGPAIARNRAIEEAKGRYIAFLDADDLWLPEKLDKQISFMNDKNSSLSYTAYDLIDEEDNNIGSFKPPSVVSYSSMLKTNSIGCLSAMYDTKYLGKVYFPDIIKKQDFALWLKILKTTNTAQGLIEPLAFYRIRKISVSSSKVKNSIFVWRIFRTHEDLNLIKSIYYFTYYTLNGLLKYKS
ncbi:MAG: Putative N-acetylgalactosaminyl-diphosphoundecaprenol glucuronosyltransferase [uncultured Sulfurovum sp.]|uniref:N-acetylgalactosaminyl-diphosphoundecaprenol glucuronosyltransferase n=1 Tax=uncultured Sulfurovum sp. TaxID=269237 RepID=A0A6S6TAW8_9BACT|nr:MAG: Putative N-acetylgalactosaminyl-diphosphoundecaprenol glucuronosyltransferase [uncultured Sulfurovum sp.]